MRLITEIRKPSKRESAVSLDELGLLLGLDKSDVVALARTCRLPVPKSARSRIPWSRVSARLDLREAHRLRAASRDTKRRLRTSKHWVAGYPDLVAQWDVERNGDLYPWQVSRGSGKRVWWRCPKGPDHVWQTAAVDRATKGTGCPFCLNHRASVTNCLATIAPKLAAEWHPTKNGSRTARDVVAAATRKVWWKCAAGPDHEWQATPYNRYRLKHGCLMCRGRLVSVTNSLVVHFPDVAAEWHPTRNRGLRVEKMTLGALRRVWWKCGRDPLHVWEQKIIKRTRQGSGCPFCCNRRAAPTTTLAARAPHLAREWHPTANGMLGPRDLTPHSNRMVWWKCPRGTDHEWQAVVRRRHVDGTGCPMWRPASIPDQLARNAAPERRPGMASDEERRLGAQSGRVRNEPSRVVAMPTQARPRVHGERGQPGQAVHRLPVLRRQTSEPGQLPIPLSRDRARVASVHEPAAHAPRDDARVEQEGLVAMSTRRATHLAHDPSESHSSGNGVSVLSRLSCAIGGGPGVGSRIGTGGCASRWARLSVRPCRISLIWRGTPVANNHVAADQAAVYPRARSALRKGCADRAPAHSPRSETLGFA